MNNNAYHFRLLSLAATATLCAACVTPPGAYLPVTKDEARLLSKVARIQSACSVEKNNGDFLAELQGSGLPGLSFEGVWENSMSKLTSDISLPMGEPIARIELEDQGTSSKVSFPGMLEPRDEVANLGAFLERIGAAGLRTFLCGEHFVPEKGDSAFVPPEGARNSGKANVRQFWIRRVMRILSHKLRITSEVDVKNENGNVLAISAVSHIRSGFIFPSNVGTFYWTGSIRNNRVVPTSAKIEVENNTYKINFYEFE